jgi:hypothetical protein
LLLAAIAAILAALWRQAHIVPWFALSIGLGLAAVSLTKPVLLKPLNILWFKFGLLLHRIVNPLVMFAVFTVVFVPVGVVMRLWRDALRLRRRSRGLSTYWIERRSGESEESMTNQY